MSAESKQQQLYNGVAKAVFTQIKPLFDELKTAQATQNSDMKVTLSALSARLEMLEEQMKSGGGPKRPAKTGTRKAAVGKAADAKPENEDPADKVKNAMLFSRWAMAHDADRLSAFITPAAQTIFDADDSCAKKDGTERKMAEGAILWKKVLTKDQQDEVRQIFKTWQEERARGAMDGQLDTDVPKE